jgi:hypothetical protein
MRVIGHVVRERPSMTTTRPSAGLCFGLGSGWWAPRSRLSREGQGVGLDGEGNPKLCAETGPRVACEDQSSKGWAGIPTSSLSRVGEVGCSFMVLLASLISNTLSTPL